MDVMEAARRAEDAGRHIIHMEVGQPGTGAPVAATGRPEPSFSAGVDPSPAPHPGAERSRHSPTDADGFCKRRAELCAAQRAGDEAGLRRRVQCRRPLLQSEGVGRSGSTLHCRDRLEAPAPRYATTSARLWSAPFSSLLRCVKQRLPVLTARLWALLLCAHCRRLLQSARRVACSTGGLGRGFPGPGSLCGAHARGG